MKFLASNLDFSSPSPYSLGLRRPARASFKQGSPLKSGYFTDNGSFSLKTIANKHRHAAYHNKHFLKCQH